MDWPHFFASLDIQGQARKQLMAGGLTPTDGVAWYLFALDQAWTTHPVGYVIQRMAAGEAPPPRYRDFANLPLGVWHIFGLAVGWRDRLPEALWQTIAADPLFSAWQQVYGAVSLEELPLDVGRGAVTVRADLTGAHHRSETEPRAGGEQPVSPADCNLWDAVLDELALQMTRPTFDSCLRNARLVARNGDAFTVAVANRRALAWVERRLRPLVERTLGALAGVATPSISFVNAEKEGET